MRRNGQGRFGRPPGVPRRRHRPGERDPEAARAEAHDLDGHRQGGDTLGAIAAAHKLTLRALLAFPQNAKYRPNPGLIHPGDRVRVK